MWWYYDEDRHTITYILKSGTSRYISYSYKINTAYYRRLFPMILSAKAYSSSTVWNKKYNLFNTKLCNKIAYLHVNNYINKWNFHISTVTLKYEAKSRVRILSKGIPDIERFEQIFKNNKIHIKVNEVYYVF